MSVFAAFRNRTTICATLEMQTALSVGSRVSLEPTGTDLPVLKGPDGLPFVPGSSLKGVVRSQMERLLRTWDRQPDLWACDPFDRPCVDGGKKEKVWKESAPTTDVSTDRDRRFAQKVWDASCTACRLFGSPWFASRVAFKDAPLANGSDLPLITQVRDGVGIDRDLGAARTGVKYDFETVVPGACFRVEILAENLEEWELGLLFTLLRLWEEGGIAIGGKTTRGTGWGRLKDIQVSQVTPENLLDYLLERKMAPQDPNPWVQAFRDRVKQIEEASHA